nr:hypothetical protein [uncultured Methanoregula sp.]
MNQSTNFIIVNEILNQVAIFTENARNSLSKFFKNVSIISLFLYSTFAFSSLLGKNFSLYVIILTFLVLFLPPVIVAYLVYNQLFELIDNNWRKFAEFLSPILICFFIVLAMISLIGIFSNMQQIVKNVNSNSLNSSSTFDKDQDCRNGYSGTIYDPSINSCVARKPTPTPKTTVDMIEFCKLYDKNYDPSIGRCGNFAYGSRITSTPIPTPTAQIGAIDSIPTVDFNDIENSASNYNVVRSTTPVDKNVYCSSTYIGSVYEPSTNSCYVEQPYFDGKEWIGWPTRYPLKF